MDGRARWAAFGAPAGLVITTVILGVVLGWQSGADGHSPWHLVTRASGLVALVSLGVAVLGGIRLSPSRPRWFPGAHVYVAVAAVVLTAVHLFSMLPVARLGIGWVQLALPFTRAADPLAQACGVVAVYCVAAVVITAALRRTLSWRWWHRTHLLAYPAFGLAMAHTVLAELSGAALRVPAFAGVTVLLTGLLKLRGGSGPGAPRPTLQAPAASGPRTVARVGPAQEPVPITAPPWCTVALLISQITWEADGILALRLAAPDGSVLPAWTQGAHLEVALPSGRLRHLPLNGGPGQRDCYQVSVFREDYRRSACRVEDQHRRGGGARQASTQPRVGTELMASPPRHAFFLCDAPAYLVLAGGIGITCLLPVSAQIAATGKPWRMVYVGRSGGHEVFARRTKGIGSGRQDVVPVTALSRSGLAGLIFAQPQNTAVYCCGPYAMEEAVLALARHRPDITVHLEQSGSGVPEQRLEQRPNQSPTVSQGAS